jgi:mannose-1-phosphate guanylyltransferase/mannose-6-phosphate isomerase
MGLSKVVPVVLCGGSGTRLWPESRRALPKQFLPLLAEESLFESTLKRASLIAPGEKVIVITNEEMRFLVQEGAERAGIEVHIILEPVARDTAAAIAVGALLTSDIEREAIALIMPSDHFIAPLKIFSEDMMRAIAAAREGSITVFGIVPSSPSTAYGYIQPGEKAPEVTGLRRVASFHEKPDSQIASGFIAAGYFWNSGLFIARADVLIDAFAMHAPDILQAAKAALLSSQVDEPFLRLDEKQFSKAPKLPFDIAVMEKTLGAAVLPARFSWSDIGAWDALWAVAEKDEAGNSIFGNVVLEDTKNALVRSSDKLVAVLGLENVAVISTTDAVLIAPKHRMQDIKQLVSRLDSEGRKEIAEHAMTHRPWGRYETKDKGERYRVKRITVKPGGRLSLQKHFHRSEHWVVVRGNALVTINERSFTLNENESTFIPIGAIHRLENPGKIPLEIIEVQVGAYLEEDDIIRLDDIYGRNRAQETKVAGRK